MEACSGTHNLAGADDKRKNQKNEGSVAQAVCEGVAPPNMRLVAVKSAEQQAVLVAHRVRTELVQSRVALINQFRRLPTEFGIVMAKARYSFGHLVSRALGEDRLPKLARPILVDVSARLQAIDADILACDRCIDRDSSAVHSSTAVFGKMQGVSSAS